MAKWWQSTHGATKRRCATEGSARTRSTRERREPGTTGRAGGSRTGCYSHCNLAPGRLRHVSARRIRPFFPLRRIHGASGRVRIGLPRRRGCAAPIRSIQNESDGSAREGTTRDAAISERGRPPLCDGRALAIGRCSQDGLPEPERRTDGSTRAASGSRESTSTSIAATSVRRGTWAIHPVAGHRPDDAIVTGIRPAETGTWERPAGSCPECGFDWEESTYEILVGQCVRNVAVFGGVLSRIDPSEAVEPGLWSASRYVWHTVDVLRFGTERLWTIAADPSFGVPTWDENVVAEVRSYDQLSPIVGLIALIAARRGLADGGVRGTARRLDPSPRGRHDLCLRRRAAKRPRGLPPPLGRSPRHRRLSFHFGFAFRVDRSGWGHPREPLRVSLPGRPGVRTLDASRMPRTTGPQLLGYSDSDVRTGDPMTDKKFGSSSRGFPRFRTPSRVGRGGLGGRGSAMD